VNIVLYISEPWVDWRTIFIIQYVGFWIGYTIPTMLLLLCPLVTWSGHRYVHLPPTGAVLSTALRLFWFAARGKWSLNPARTYKNLTATDFWDNAKPSKQAIRPEWMNFDDQWVDEVKRGFKACGVFCWFPVFCRWTPKSPTLR